MSAITPERAAELRDEWRRIARRSSEPRCSFCEKPDGLFVSGTPGVFICRGCVERCNEMFAEYDASVAVPGTTEEP